jgi:hypothetical protein
VLPSIPNKDDVEYYYKTLLDLQDAKITMTNLAVPEEFNTSLLPSHEDAPSNFPCADLETEPAEHERREKYSTFLRQLCEMERSRAILKNFTRPVSQKKAPKYTTAVTEEPLFLIGYAAASHGQSGTRAWVQEILRDLNPETDETSLTVVSPPDFPPYGWILTPSSASTRYSQGSRLLLDKTQGMKWERLLGSDLYPDLLVSRRLTSRGWAFQDRLSETLIESTVNWYLGSQDVTVTDGLTPFMIGVEKELSALFSAFKAVRVSNRLLESAGESNPQSRVLKFLQNLEAWCLVSAEANPDVQPISGSVFHKFLNYLFRAAEIPRDAYVGDDNVRATVDRWVKSEFGFKEGAESILSKWTEMWDLVMRGKPTAVRVNHFLASMDVWDPVLSASYRRNIERPAVAQEWIRIFLDTQLIRETNARIRSTTLHENIRRWCLRFLPEEMFGPQFAPVNVGPVLTKKGFITSKLRDGRFIVGYKLRQDLSHAEESPVESEEPVETIKANTVVFTETTTTTADGEEVKNATAVHHRVVEEKDGTIEHFLFSSSVSKTVPKDTIDLGRI